MKHECERSAVGGWGEEGVGEHVSEWSAWLIEDGGMEE